MAATPMRELIRAFDRVGDMIVVQFADGHTTAYPAQFLYDLRADDRTTTLETAGIFPPG